MNDFLVNALSLVNQVAILFVLIAAGFICTKTKLIIDKSKDGIVNILLIMLQDGNLPLPAEKQEQPHAVSRAVQ